MKSKKGYIFDAAYLAALAHSHDQALTELRITRRQATIPR